jgi:ribosomal 50S subunit-recycling heat shock protein
MHKYKIATYKTTLKERCKSLWDIPNHIDWISLKLKLAPTVEQTRLLCDTGRIRVNGKLVKNNYKVKKFDLIHTDFINERLAYRVEPVMRRKRSNKQTIIIKNDFIRHGRKKIYIRYRSDFKHYGKKKRLFNYYYSNLIRFNGLLY